MHIFYSPCFFGSTLNYFCVYIENTSPWTACWLPAIFRTCSTSTSWRPCSWKSRQTLSWTECPKMRRSFTSTWSAGCRAISTSFCPWVPWAASSGSAVASTPRSSTAPPLTGTMTGPSLPCSKWACPFWSGSILALPRCWRRRSRRLKKIRSHRCVLLYIFFFYFPKCFNQHTKFVNLTFN